MSSLPLDLELLGGECAFLSTNSATECPMRRRCRDCLLKPGCMISATGACVSNKTASIDRDFRRAFELNLTLPAARTTNSLALGTIQEWEFPALKATYCPIGDTVCATCVQEKFWFSSSDSRFCVGAGGCVCIFECEVFPLEGPSCLRIPSVSIAPTTAPTPWPTPAITTTSQLEPDSTEWWAYVAKQLPILMAVFAGFLLITCVGCCCAWKHRSRHSPRSDRLVPAVAAATIPVENNTKRVGHETDTAAYCEM